MIISKGDILEVILTYGIVECKVLSIKDHTLTLGINKGDSIMTVDWNQEKVQRFYNEGKLLKKFGGPMNTFPVMILRT